MNEKKILWASILAGGVFGFMVLSPFAMIVSESHHLNGPIHFPSLLKHVLRESFGIGYWVWKLTHLLVGASLGLLFGLVFQKFFKEEKVLHQLREQFRNEEMTMEIGKLVRGIVHNINNHLTVLRGNMDLLKMDYPTDSKIDAVLNSAKELAVLAQNIMDHAKGRKGVTLGIDLNQVIKKNLEFLAGNPFLKKQVTVNLDLDSNLAQIQGDEADFSQAIFNLMDNAVDAMTKSARKELKIRSRQDENSIFIDIIDSGEGIPKDILGKLFTPGFTTKPFQAKEGEPTGTGFGLANVKDLLKSYQVNIDVSSKPGETRFTLAIPKKIGVPQNINLAVRNAA